MFSQKRKTKGFTLMEILIVLIILGVMAGLAIPILQGNVARGYRQEALQHLETTRGQATQFFAQNTTYVGMAFPVVGYDPNAAIGGQTVNFAYVLGGLAAGTYTVTATCNAGLPCAGQTVTINQAGVVGGTLT